MDEEDSIRIIINYWLKRNFIALFFVEDFNPLQKIIIHNNLFLL